MSRRKQQSAFDQVSEFDRGMIVAYGDCGLSFRKIGSRGGRNQTTLMRICDRWIHECTTERAQWSVHKTSIVSSTLDANHRRRRRQWCGENRMWAVEWNEIFFTKESGICLEHHDGRIRVCRHRGDRMLNSCIMHRHTGPATGIRDGAVLDTLSHPSSTHCGYFKQLAQHL
ncbi:transposable element Tc1 transposase [Trichonephila clavipes]|nr:transposable element Tc1 transposase [Trichonephila clavipes]